MVSFVLPQHLVVRFMAQQKNSRCAVMHEVKADHQLGWAAQWSTLLHQLLTC